MKTFYKKIWGFFPKKNLEIRCGSHGGILTLALDGRLVSLNKLSKKKLHWTNPRHTYTLERDNYESWWLIDDTMFKVMDSEDWKPTANVKEDDYKILLLTPIEGLVIKRLLDKGETK